MRLVPQRVAAALLALLTALALTGALGAFNGGTLVRPDGTLVSAERLRPDVAQRALDMIARPEIIRWLFHDGRWHAERVDDVYAVRERRAANQEPIVGGDFSKLVDAADKVVAVSDDHDLLARLEREIGDALGENATVMRSQTYYLDITAPRANKGDGIAALAKAAGVPLDRVAAIGDQRNDMAMFARAGFSVAMGQGPEEVRKAASCVTASNEEDGVAQAIDKILLPMVRGA